MPHKFAVLTLDESGVAKIKMNINHFTDWKFKFTITKTDAKLTHARENERVRVKLKTSQKSFTFSLQFGKVKFVHVFERKPHTHTNTQITKQKLYRWNVLAQWSWFYSPFHATWWNKKCAQHKNIRHWNKIPKLDRKFHNHTSNNSNVINQRYNSFFASYLPVLVPMPVPDSPWLRFNVIRRLCSEISRLVSNFWCDCWMFAVVVERLPCVRWSAFSQQKPWYVLCYVAANQRRNPDV